MNQGNRFREPQRLACLLSVPTSLVAPPLVAALSLCVGQRPPELDWIAIMIPNFQHRQRIELLWISYPVAVRN